MCPLCDIKPSDEDSHIIPAFIFRWIKATSPTGFLRRVSEQNRRVQDGVKYKLLCISCEDRFSKWENQFAQNAFYPATIRQLPIHYNDWMSKFSVSLLWRALHIMVKMDAAELQKSLKGKIDPIYNTWKDFLNGKRSDPGPHEIHVFPVDIVQGGSLPDDIGPINFYLTRSTDIDVCSNEERAYVYAHFPHFIFFGRIYDNKPRFTAKSRLHIRRGKIGGRGSSYVMPADLMHYVYSRSRYIRDQMQVMSQEQVNKIEESVLKGSRRIKSSPAFEAGFADYILREHHGRR